MPKVTVVMPVYNAHEYLHDAISSILGQTFTDFEFLIIDDGSYDNSAEIVKSFHDRRIRFNDCQLLSICELERCCFELLFFSNRLLFSI